MIRAFTLAWEAGIMRTQSKFGGRAEP